MLMLDGTRRGVVVEVALRNRSLPLPEAGRLAMEKETMDGKGEDWQFVVVRTYRHSKDQNRRIW